MGLFPKSGTNEFNQGRKDQILAKVTQTEMTWPQQLKTKNNTDSGFRQKVLDFIFMCKKELIVHRQFTNTITNRFADASQQKIKIESISML